MNAIQNPVHALTAEEERLAQMMKALGNPHRMAIMLYLTRNPQCITSDIVAATPLAQSTVSQHLKVLREAGLICGTIEGPATNYCVDDDNLRWFRSKITSLL